MSPSGWSTEPDPPAADLRDASRGPRLQKVLAEAGVASRRACEELIESGAVAVNGVVVTELPAWVDPRRDRITVEGEGIGRPEPHVYVMLFKPRGVVSTNKDDAGRRRAIDLVPHPSRARLFAVGRLDVESSGLLLLTNDGELANRLTHPRYGVHKVYEVTVNGSLDEADVKKLESGVFLSDQRSSHGRRRGGRTSPTRLRLLKRGRDRTKLRMELREGRNRQVRRMMLYVGHKVRKLRRVQMGPLTLKGLRPGEWRDLTEAEVDALRAASTVKSGGRGQKKKQKARG
jgi:pseudouridine synthase